MLRMRLRTMHNMSPLQTHPYMTAKQPVVLAHQGDSVNAPANTMVAFERANALGVDALETDVHWTKDGVIVVSHDATVDRMSNGSGFIKEMSFSNLRKLDFGYTFTPDGGKTYPFRNQGVQIPTLREVLDAFPNLCVNIDVKPKRPTSIKQLIEEIQACGATNRVLLASFHHAVLRRIRATDGAIATSASPVDTAITKLLSLVHLPGGWRQAYIAEQVPVQMGRMTVVSDRFVRHIHQAGRKLHVWTIDDEGSMWTLLKMGVDGIVTNNPALARKVRDAFLTTL